MTPICTPWNFELTAASRSTTDSPLARGRAASAIRPTSRLVYRMLHLSLLQLDVPSLAEHRLHVLVSFFVVGKLQLRGVPLQFAVEVDGNRPEHYPFSVRPRD